MAPSVESYLPSIVQSAASVIALGCENKVPFITLFAPTSIAPSAIQKTLEACVSPVKIISEPVLL
jgi:hypothetical protein